MPPSRFGSHSGVGKANVLAFGHGSYPASDFSRGHLLLNLGALTSCRAQQVSHAHGLVQVRGEKSGIERDVSDVPAGHVQTGQLVHIETLNWGFKREDAL